MIKDIENVELERYVHRLESARKQNLVFIARLKEQTLSLKVKLKLKMSETNENKLMFYEDLRAIESLVGLPEENRCNTRC
jgi:hypothetical protein